MNNTDIKVGDKVYMDYDDYIANKDAVVTEIKDGICFVRFPDGKIGCGNIYNFIKGKS